MQRYPGWSDQYDLKLQMVGFSAMVIMLLFGAICKRLNSRSSTCERVKS